MTKTTWLAAATVLALGCSKSDDTPRTAASTPPPAPVEPVKADPPPPPKPAFTEVAGFSTPESVLVLGEPDLYLVSNINGNPTGKDDNGFISKLGPDGKVVELKWIDGEKPDVTLHAPKGMGVRGGVLYVADIDVVRKFDLATGAPRGEIKIKKASFLNDVAVDGDVVYVTDSGLDPSFKPTGTDAVHTIDAKDRPKALLAAKDLGAPNGVTVIDGKVWVVTFGGKALFRIDGGKKVDAQELAAGQLDGIAALGDGRVAVSSWESKTIYAGTPGGELAPLFTDVAAPADFGVDLKREVLLVPLFEGNTVRIYPY